MINRSMGKWSTVARVTCARNRKKAANASHEPDFSASERVRSLAPVKNDG